MNFKPYVRMMLTAIALSVSSLISAQVHKPVLTEDFESGTMPDGWTQEYVIRQHSWVVEGSALSHPDGAASGKHRIALRNSSRQREGFKTRLILPPVDISEIPNPVVTFSYAQDAWAGDFDTLRVLYRTSAEAEWMVLETFDKYRSRWTSANVELGVPSATAQIAFEGVDNLGRGVVLDDIQIRSCPECSRPIVTVSNITDADATVYWSGSSDTKEFHIRVSKEPLSDFKLNSSRDEFMCEPIDILVHGSLRFYTIEQLELGTEYFVYVRALCGSESSIWSTEASFFTNQKVSAPYHETFNMDHIGVIQKPRHWYTGTSFNIDVPYVNTQISSSNLPSYSDDATPCLVFDNYQRQVALDAGNYAYAASPEINTDDISTLQITFTGGRGRAYRDPVDSYLAVGVMTDPEDYSTFVPVDTVSMNKTTSATFEEFIIPLTKAKGSDAKYVAFVSDGKTPTTFYVDNVIIRKIPTCPKATDLSFSIKQADEVQLSWNTHGCPMGDVLVLNRPLFDDSDIDAAIADMEPSEYRLLESQTLPVTIDALQPASQYYVYARNRKDTDVSEWSVVKLLNTPHRLKPPYEYTFDIDENDESTFVYPDPSKTHLKLMRGLTYHFNTTEPPQCKKNNIPGRKDYLLYARIEPGRVAYVSFPEVENIKGSRISFWTQTADVYGEIIVGVMEDISDTSTFVAIDTIRSERNYWTRYSFDMSRYTYAGRFFTLKYQITDGRQKVQMGVLNVDNVRFDPLPLFPDPKDVSIAPSVNGAEITWDDNGATAWEVKVSDIQAYDSLETEGFKWIYAEKLTENKATVTQLIGNGKKYFAFLRSIPADGNNPTDWMGPFEFFTDCYDPQPFPYTLDFKSAVLKGQYWTMPCIDMTYSLDASSQVGSFPHIFNYNMMQIKTTSKTKDDIFIVLPQMGAPLNQLSLNMKFNGQSASLFEIGAIKTRGDYESFLVVDTVDITGREKRDEFFYFSDVTSEYNHLAIRVSKTANANLTISELVVDMLDGCARMQKVGLDSIYPSGAKISWQDNGESEWDVVLSKSKLLPEALTALMSAPHTPTDDIPFAKTVQSNPATVDGLYFNSRYYVYVRSKCVPAGGRGLMSLSLGPTAV